MLHMMLSESPVLLFAVTTHILALSLKELSNPKLHGGAIQYGDSLPRLIVY